MSNEAVGYAFKAAIDEPAVKLVLAMLADSASVHTGYEDEGHITWLGNKKIAAWVNRDVRTVKRYRGWLIEHGYLREAGDQGPVVGNPKYPAHERPIVYQVAISDAMRDSWAANPRVDGVRAAAVESGSSARQGDGVTPVSPPPTSTKAGGGDTSVTGGRDTHVTGGRDTGVPGGRDTGVTQTQRRTNPKIGTSDDSLRSSSARPAETQQSMIDPPPPAATELAPMQKAEAIAKAWVTRRREQGIPVPNAKQVHMAVRGYVKAALEEGVTEAHVKAALDRAGETLPSASVWRRALEEVVTGRTQVRPWQRGQVPYRDPVGVNDVDMNELFGTGGAQ